MLNACKEDYNAGRGVAREDRELPLSDVLAALHTRPASVAMIARRERMAAAAARTSAYIRELRAEEAIRDAMLKVLDDIGEIDRVVDDIKAKINTVTSEYGYNVEEVGGGRNVINFLLSSRPAWRSRTSSDRLTIARRLGKLNLDTSLSQGTRRRFLRVPAVADQLGELRTLASRRAALEQQPSTLAASLGLGYAADRADERANGVTNFGLEVSFHVVM
jgi:hypothetical protein